MSLPPFHRPAPFLQSPSPSPSSLSSLAVSQQNLNQSSNNNNNDNHSSSLISQITNNFNNTNNYIPQSQTQTQSMNANSLPLSLSLGPVPVNLSIPSGPPAHSPTQLQVLNFHQSQTISPHHLNQIQNVNNSNNGSSGLALNNQNNFSNLQHFNHNSNNTIKNNNNINNNIKSSVKMEEEEGDFSDEEDKEYNNGNNNNHQDESSHNNNIHKQRGVSLHHQSLLTTNNNNNNQAFISLNPSQSNFNQGNISFSRESSRERERDYNHTNSNISNISNVSNVGDDQVSMSPYNEPGISGAIFPISSDLSVTCFLRSIRDFADSEAGPLFVVREFDNKIIRSVKQPKKGLSEQAIRAGIRQAMLNLKMKLEPATRGEIQVLKSSGILGKRAPSASLCVAEDMCKLLEFYQKKQAAMELRAAVQRNQFRVNILTKEFESKQGSFPSNSNFSASKDFNRSSNPKPKNPAGSSNKRKVKKPKKNMDDGDGFDDENFLEENDNNDIYNENFSNLDDSMIGQDMNDFSNDQKARHNTRPKRKNAGFHSHREMDANNESEVFETGANGSQLNNNNYNPPPLTNTSAHRGRPRSVFKSDIADNYLLYISNNYRPNMDIVYVDNFPPIKENTGHDKSYSYDTGNNYVNSALSALSALGENSQFNSKDPSISKGRTKRKTASINHKYTSDQYSTQENFEEDQDQDYNPHNRPHSKKQQTILPSYSNDSRDSFQSKSFLNSTLANNINISSGGSNISLRPNNSSSNLNFSSYLPLQRLDSHSPPPQRSIISSGHLVRENSDNGLVEGILVRSPSPSPLRNTINHLSNRRFSLPSSITSVPSSLNMNSSSNIATSPTMLSNHSNSNSNLYSLASPNSFVNNNNTSNLKFPSSNSSIGNSRMQLNTNSNNNVNNMNSSSNTISRYSPFDSTLTNSLYTSLRRSNPNINASILNSSNVDPVTPFLNLTSNSPPLPNGDDPSQSPSNQNSGQNSQSLPFGKKNRTDSISLPYEMDPPSNDSTENQSKSKLGSMSNSNSNLNLNLNLNYNLNAAASPNSNSNSFSQLRSPQQSNFSLSNALASVSNSTVNVNNMNNSTHHNNGINSAISPRPLLNILGLGRNPRPSPSLLSDFPFTGRASPSPSSLATTLLRMNDRVESPGPTLSFHPLTNNFGNNSNTQNNLSNVNVIDNPNNNASLNIPNNTNNNNSHNNSNNNHIGPHQVPNSVTPGLPLPNINIAPSPELSMQIPLFRSSSQNEKENQLNQLDALAWTTGISTMIHQNPMIIEQSSDHDNQSPNTNGNGNLSNNNMNSAHNSSANNTNSNSTNSSHNSCSIANSNGNNTSTAENSRVLLSQPHPTRSVPIRFGINEGEPDSLS